MMSILLIVNKQIIQQNKAVNGEGHHMFSSSLSHFYTAVTKRPNPKRLYPCPQIVEDLWPVSLHQPEVVGLLFYSPTTALNQAVVRTCKCVTA